MEEVKRSASPKSVRGSKLAHTFSRFKGIIRIPAARKSASTTPGQHATTKPTPRENRGRTETPQRHPYSRTSVVLKPYMSQPTLAMGDPDSDGSSTSAEPSPSRVNHQQRSPSVHSLSSPEEFKGKDSLDLSTPPPNPPPLANPTMARKTLSPPPSRPIPPIPPEENAQPRPSILFMHQSSPAPTRSMTETASHRLYASESTTTAAPIPSASPIQRSASETDTEPKLSVPPVLARRVSLLEAVGGGARLSPTILHRPPPLPILNLPKLPTIVLTEETVLSRRRSAKVGLSAMPALPLQGTMRGVTGAEEVDDMEEDDETDEEEDEEFEDALDHEEDSPPIASSSSTATSRMSEDSLTGRGSYDLRRSFQSERSSEEHGEDAASGLPWEDTRSHGPSLDSTVASSAGSSSFSGGGEGMVNGLPLVDKKGKSRLIIPGLPERLDEACDVQSLQGYYHFDSLAPTSASTSTSTSAAMGASFSTTQKPQHQYAHPHSGSTPPSQSKTSFDAQFSSRRLVIPEAHQSIPSNPGGSACTPVAQRQDPFLSSCIASNSSGSSSPLATPRALAYFDFQLPLDTFGEDKNTHAKPRLSRGISHSGGSGGGAATASSNAVANASSNRSSMVLDGGSGHTTPTARFFPARPSMYKRASRSLIDIHEIETREEVERMVREGEEEQERELKRRASQRRSRQISATDMDVLRHSGGESLRRSIVHDRLRTMEEQEEEEGVKLPDRDGERPSNVSAPPTTTAPTRVVNATQTVPDGPGTGHLVPDMTAFEQDVGVSPIGLVMDDGYYAAQGTSTSQTNLKTPTPSTSTSNAAANSSRRSAAPEYDLDIPSYSEDTTRNILPLRKRRSMPTFTETTAPPPYPSFAPFRAFGGLKPGIKILPREDEGKEELPPYSNAISLRAIMPRKMEFDAPGVQAKDRKWKRVLVVLEGTMLKIYRCPVGHGGVSAIEQWWESKVGAGDMTNFVPSAPVRPTSSRNKEQEKVQQQYLRNPLNGEPSLASGSQEASQAYGKRKGSGGDVTVTKSALNLAVNFLKSGSKQHGRSNSDLGPPPSPTVVSSGTPRPSLNLPRTATATPTSSSIRSHSPMPSSSSSRTVASRSTTPLPSTSSSVSSRPATPSAMNSTRTARAKAATVPKHARSNSKKSTSSLEPSPNALIRCYTMQKAESGLGNDYVKRRNVIRVRLEGEQFLLQACDVASVVEWIEGLQAATNIALDLDERPMPRGPIFPRRRRRRRPAIPAINTTGVPAPASGPGETYTPTSATAGQPALRRE